MYCEGLSTVDSSTRPSATSAYVLCAAARLLKTSAILAQMSTLGNVPVSFNASMSVSSYGTFLVSLETWLTFGGGASLLLIMVNSVIGLSVIIFRIILVSANCAELQMGINAVQ